MTKLPLPSPPPLQLGFSATPVAGRDWEGRMGGLLLSLVFCLFLLTGIFWFEYSVFKLY